MLAQQYRLNLREEKDFFARCSRIHTPYFSFFYIPADLFKATVIISKKVLPLATKRNAAKRKFKSAIQAVLNNLIKLKIKLVIVVHSQGTQLSVNELSQQIEKNVQKIRV